MAAARPDRGGSSSVAVGRMRAARLQVWLKVASGSKRCVHVHKHTLMKCRGVLHWSGETIQDFRQQHLVD